MDQFLTPALTLENSKLAYGEDNKRLHSHKLEAIMKTAGNVNMDRDGCSWTLSTTRLFTMTFSDPLDRAMGKVNANGFWSKVIISSWSNIALDTGAVTDCVQSAPGS